MIEFEGEKIKRDSDRVEWGNVAGDHPPLPL